MFGGAKRSAAELVPSLPLPQAEPYEDKRSDHPAELRLRKVAAHRAEVVQWPSIAVTDGCTLCPVCTNVCPTKAVERERVEGLSEEYVLKFKVSACTGCGACVESCPPQVILLVEASRDAVLGDPLDLFRGTPPWYDF